MSASPETLLARRKRSAGTDRISGFVLAALMLAAVALVAQRIYVVATGPTPPRAGAEAPGFSAPLLDTNRSVSLADYRGKVVVLDFWATWCPPCVASLPHLQKIHKAYEDRGALVLGVNQEPGQEAAVQRFLERRRISFPSVVDAGAIHTRYGVYTFPTTFVIDAEGVIRASFRGPASESAIRAAVQSALEKSPQAARDS